MGTKEMIAPSGAGFEEISNSRIDSSRKDSKQSGTHFRSHIGRAGNCAQNSHKRFCSCGCTMFHASAHKNAPDGVCCSLLCRQRPIKGRLKSSSDGQQTYGACRSRCTCSHRAAALVPAQRARRLLAKKASTRGVPSLIPDILSSKSPLSTADTT